VFEAPTSCAGTFFFDLFFPPRTTLPPSNVGTSPLTTFQGREEERPFFLSAFPPTGGTWCFSGFP